MTRRQTLDTAAPPLAIRGGRFEDVSGILGLIEEAIEHGCRDHYDATQRRVVFLGYASSLFVDALGPFALWTAEVGGGWRRRPAGPVVRRAAGAVRGGGVSGAGGRARAARDGGDACPRRRLHAAGGRDVAQRGSVLYPGRLPPRRRLGSAADRRGAGPDRPHGEAALPSPTSRRGWRGPRRRRASSLRPRGSGSGRTPSLLPPLLPPPPRSAFLGDELPSNTELYSAEHAKSTRSRFFVPAPLPLPPHSGRLTNIYLPPVPAYPFSFSPPPLLPPKPSPPLPSPGLLAVNGPAASSSRRSRSAHSRRRRSPGW